MVKICSYTVFPGAFEFYFYFLNVYCSNKSLSLLVKLKPKAAVCQSHKIDGNRLGSARNDSSWQILILATSLFSWFKSNLRNLKRIWLGTEEAKSSYLLKFFLSPYRSSGLFSCRNYHRCVKPGNLKKIEQCVWSQIHSYIRIDVFLFKLL